MVEHLFDRRWSDGDLNALKRQLMDDLMKLNPVTRNRLIQDLNLLENKPSSVNLDDVWEEFLNKFQEQKLDSFIKVLK